MSEFKKYRRKQIAELRPITQEDIDVYKSKGSITGDDKDFTNFSILYTSISNADKENGSPKVGDMIARNPKNYLDQWLVAEQYFKDNFEEI